ncbi:SDR family NAD(P)-dependent oxidoreductase [Actinomadura scrupuli]|uniref:SDR family NAD(P)-dependent oxidoreductase n=1 Tax=Actinomadura scrupuli TaxID=559629 RepID=UPI003D9A0ACB
MELSGAHVLITGATGGIGQAIAVAVAARGGEVILTGRRTDVLEPLATRLGGRAIAADLADRAGVTELLDAAGDLDVIVANAALPGSGLLTDYSVEEIDRALEVNLRAPIVLARLAAARLSARGRGHLVFINSLSGKTASGGAAMYNATKFGLRGFALALREDLRPHGVGVSTVFPGFIRDAGMFADSGVTLPRGVGTRTPADVARAVVRAVEKNVAEIDVAPVPLRLATFFGGVAPGLAASVQRRVGGDKITEQMAAGQREKR